MTPEQMAAQAVLDAAKRWYETVYQDRRGNVWPEEQRLGAAVEALSFARKDPRP